MTTLEKNSLRGEHILLILFTNTIHRPRQHQAAPPPSSSKHLLGARITLSGHSPIYPRPHRDQTPLLDEFVPKLLGKREKDRDRT